MFKKQYFPETTIQSLATNQTVFNRGKKLNNESSVKDLKINKQTETIIFSVKGTSNYYRVQLKFYSNGVARKYQCTCPAFKKYSGACKHVVCSMLYLNTLNQEDLQGLNSSKIEKKNRTSENQGLSNLSLGANSPNVQKKNEVLTKLRDSTQSVYQSAVSTGKRKIVNFEFVLNISGSYSAHIFEVYMKIGLDHLYVIKNQPHVILNLLEANSYEFGKNFTYDPEHHAIREEDRKVLEVLYRIYQLVRSVNQTSYEASYANKAELEIPPQFLQEVSEAISDTDGGFIRYGRPPEHLSRIDNLEKINIEKRFKNIPIYFSLTKKGTRYNFQVENYDRYENPLIFYTGTNIIQYKHDLYFVSSAEFNTLQSVFEALKEIEYQSISMKGYELTDFLAQIFPVLNSLFKVQVDEDIKRLTIMEELTAELYLNYQNNNLSIYPVFKYGETKVYPLNEETTTDDIDQILVRKPDKESELFDLLFAYIDNYKIENNSIIVSDLEDISYFIFEGMENLAEDFEFYSTEAVKKLVYQPTASPSVSMEINNETNLLDITFETENIEEADLQNIIYYLNQNDSSYYKLSNGQIVNLKQNEFQQLNDTASKLDIDEKQIQEEMSVPLYKGLSVLEDSYIQKGEEFRNLAKALLEPQDLDFEVPSELDNTLRPYQKTGFQWLKTLDYYQFGGVLADDMGLGKTIQTITFILSKLEEKDGKYLIVCPSSVLYNWNFEFNKFAPSISTVLVTGSMEERKNIIKENKNNKSEVWITSYPLIQRDEHLYSDIYFETTVLDESQNVKNSAAKTTQAVQQIKSTNKFALSGTPIENNLDELWSLFSIIQPGLFNNKSAFKKMDHENIALRIRPFILRRLKSEVLDDLPPKTETVEHIELSDNQKQIYQTQLAMIKKDVKEYIEFNEFDSNRMKILSGMTRLRQICCDPRLINQNYEGESSKLERLFEYLKEARINGKKVVVFSQFTQMLAIIRKRLDQQNIDYHYLDGQTKKEDRLDLTTRFNQGEKDLFLISLKAGGTGLNLTGGDTVILYDSWWNPAIEDQAADRVHRFGQKKAVQVIRLIAKGTIEERISQLQDKKRELVDSVIESNTNNQNNITTLTKNEILKLLEIE